jgi:hypothetical protein
MKHIKTPALALLSVAFLLFVFSCKKETDNFTQFPIDIIVKDSVGTTKISWSKVETSDFIEYVVVRSTIDSIPAFSALNSNHFIIARINDSKKLEALDFNNGQVFSKAYYRVFARLQNRTISSANFSTNSDITLTKITNVIDIVKNELNAQQFFITTSDNKIYNYDIEQDKIITQNLSLPIFQPRVTVVSDNGNVPHIIVWNNGTRRIYLLETNNLSIIKTIDFNASVYGVTASNDGFFFVTTDEFNKQFKLFKLSDYTIVAQSGLPQNAYLSSSAITVKIPNRKEIVVHDGSSSSTIYKFTYDNDGIITSSTRIGQINLPNSSNAFLRVSNKGKYLLINGTLFNDNINLNAPLANFFGFNPLFNEEETKLYVQATNAPRLTIEEFNLSDMKLSQSIMPKLSNFNFARAFPYKNTLIAFTSISTNTSSNVLVYQKIKL